MKRIAMISLHTSPLASEEGKETGGMNVYILKFSEELAKLNNQVDMFTYRNNQRDQPIITISPNLRVIHLPAGPIQHIPKKHLITHIDEFTQNLFNFIQTEKISYNIIHSHYYLSGLVALALKNRLRIPPPIIHSFHTLGLMKNLVAREETEREDKQRINSEFLLTQQADGIITSSETDKMYVEYLYNGNKEKIFAVTPGVDRSTFKPMNKDIAKRFIHATQKHKIILFVGRIEPLKGIDGLIYALKILLTKDSTLPLCLWIVGGDISQKSNAWSKELQKLEQLRSLLHLVPNVTFVGQQQQKMLPHFYNAAELVVMPSHYESFGIAALEAMACGTPVITTNVSGITDILTNEDQALVTSVNNPLELSEKMEYLLTNRDIYQQVSRDIIERTKNFDWKIITKRLLRIYANYI